MSDRMLAVILFTLAAASALFVRPPPWLVVIVAVVIVLRTWLWFCRRHPLIAICIAGFLRGLLGGRR